MNLEGIMLYDAMTKEIEAFKAKPTKAGSKRMRALNNSIRKNAAILNKQLLEADKAGYPK